MLLNAIATLKVVVIGEAMLDCYLVGVAERLCQEAPVPVVNVSDRRTVPGGAANTAVNVRSLGAKVTFISVVGDDWEGEILRQALAERSVSPQHVFTQPGRRTLAKQRVMAVDQLLVRFDSGSTDPINGEIEQQLIDQLESAIADCDAVIVSDYRYGILTNSVIEAIAKFQSSSKRILVVDSKQLSAYRHVGVTAVKPNYEEAVQLLGISKCDRDTRIDQMIAHKEQLLHLTGAQIVAVTLDASGGLIFERQIPTTEYRTRAEPATHTRATGAGDTFVSALTLALAAGAETPAAADFAAAAAAVVVGKDGTTACSAQELRFLGGQRETSDKCVSASMLRSRIAEYRAAGCRIVFTNGCFDILHSGHVSYLNRAKALGDILIIGVNSDHSIRRLKGSTRPINPLEDRLQVLAGLSCVDLLIPFDEDTPSNLIQIVRPDVFVKGGDYTRETLPEATLVEQLGGVVEILPFLENRSTTSIIERISRLG